MEPIPNAPDEQSPASDAAAGSTAVCLTEETFEAIMDYIIGRANCSGGWWNDNRTFNLVNRIRRETGRGMMADQNGNTAALRPTATDGYASWYVGCAYPKGQQVVTEQEDGLTYLVATAHANGDDYRKNARIIAAAPKALHLLERLAGFAAHYASESAIRAGGDLLIAEAEGLLREVRGA